MHGFWGFQGPSSETETMGVHTSFANICCTGMLGDGALWLCLRSHDRCCWTKCWHTQTQVQRARTMQLQRLRMCTCSPLVGALRWGAAALC